MNISSYHLIVFILEYSYENYQLLENPDWSAGRSPATTNCEGDSDAYVRRTEALEDDAGNEVEASSLDIFNTEHRHIQRIILHLSHGHVRSRRFLVQIKYA